MYSRSEQIFIMHLWVNPLMAVFQTFLHYEILLSIFFIFSLSSLRFFLFYLVEQDIVEMCN